MTKKHEKENMETKRAKELEVKVMWKTYAKQKEEEEAD